MSTTLFRNLTVIQLGKKFLGYFILRVFRCTVEKISLLKCVTKDITFFDFSLGSVQNYASDSARPFRIHFPHSLCFKFIPFLQHFSFLRWHTFIHRPHISFFHYNISPISYPKAIVCPTAMLIQTALQ